MKKTHRVFLFSIPVILALLFSTLEAIPVFAEDATPPTDPIVETVDSASADSTVESAQPETNSTERTEVAVSEEAAPTEAPTEEAPALEITEAAPVMQEESMDTLPQILAAVPDGTEIVILDENGDPQSMVSQDAAETLVQGDPVWCPTGHVPGDAQCTASYSTFAELINVLKADAALGAGAHYTGDGIIYVADSYDGNDNAQIHMNGNELTNISSSSLTIQGGWNDLSGDAGTPGISETDVSMSIFNWLGNITLQNLFISNISESTKNNGFGLHVDTEGYLTLNNVSASGSTNGNDGALLISDAGMAITNSHFDNNTDFGVMAWSSNGTINITDSTASHNTKTGAYLDTCGYNSTLLTCASSGTVNVNGISTFSNNGLDGLHIVSGGSTIINGNSTTERIIAESNGLRGAFIINGISGNSGMVVVQNSSLLSNANGTGLAVFQDADGVIVLNNVIAANNGTGVYIDDNNGTGSISISLSQFYNNIYTGLHVESNGDITLTDSAAGSLTLGDGNGNGSNGAYLVSDGNIIAANSQFNENVQSNYPQDPGLYAKAGGFITLDNVQAIGNVYGAGAVAKSSGIGDINIVNNSIFDNNGTFGIQAENGNGNITLSSIQANHNAIKGAYLKSNGTSNIFVNVSEFIENGSYGVYATADGGNISINSSTFNGGKGSITNPTAYGAKLIASSGGNIIINGGTYINHASAGLYLIGDDSIFLNNVTASNNGENNVAIYSTYTSKGCYCPGDTPSSVVATVEGGTFTNAETGIYAKVGTEGDLVLTGTQDFSETLVDYVLDTDALPMCTDCGCTKDETESKPYNIIEVPFTGSGNIPQQCSIYAGTVLQMPNGISVKVRCPFTGFSNLQGMNETDLPGLLGTGADFELGIILGLFGEDGSYIVNSDGTITINFTIPEGTRSRAHSLLFWDLTLNDGAGGWIELPRYEFGTSFPLHPEDPSDPRLIVNGVSQNGNTLSITVNFGGTFVMVSN